MRILGIDPGAATGWCIYDSGARRVLACGMFPEFQVPDDWETGLYHLGTRPRVAMEIPVAHGPTRPEVVRCAYVAGRLFAILNDRCALNVDELTRHEIRRRLQMATHGVVRVANDATVWAALKLLHGDGCDKKGGALHGVKSHARAALAAAVAFALPAAEKTKEAT